MTHYTNDSPCSVHVPARVASLCLPVANDCFLSDHWLRSSRLLCVYCTQFVGRSNSLACAVDSRLSNQDIPCLLLNPKVHCRVHNSSQLDSVFNQFNPVHTFIFYFLKVNFSIELFALPEPETTVPRCSSVSSAKFWERPLTCQDRPFPCPSFLIRIICVDDNSPLNKTVIISTYADYSLIEVP
jgi:hypothetical protein